MTFTAALSMENGSAVIRLAGELDSGSAGDLTLAIEEAAEQRPGRLVLLMRDLTYLSSAGLRCLVFAQRTMPPRTPIVVVGATADVAETIRLTGFDRTVVMDPA